MCLCVCVGDAGIYYSKTNYSKEIPIDVLPPPGLCPHPLPRVTTGSFGRVFYWTVFIASALAYVVLVWGSGKLNGSVL